MPYPRSEQRTLIVVAINGEWSRLDGSGLTAKLGGKKFLHLGSEHVVLHVYEPRTRFTNSRVLSEAATEGPSGMRRDLDILEVYQGIEDLEQKVRQSRTEGEEGRER